MTADKPRDQVPDAMPEELLEQRGSDLMATLRGFCEQSDLPRAQIIGALEGVKHVLLRHWLELDEEEEGDEDPW